LVQLPWHKGRRRSRELCPAVAKKMTSREMPVLKDMRLEDEGKGRRGWRTPHPPPPSALLRVRKKKKGTAKSIGPYKTDPG